MADERNRPEEDALSMDEAAPVIVALATSPPRQELTVEDGDTVPVPNFGDMHSEVFEAVRALLCAIATAVSSERAHDATRVAAALGAIQQEPDVTSRRRSLLWDVDYARARMPDETGWIEEQQVTQCPECFGWTEVAPCPQCGYAVLLVGTLAHARVEEARWFRDSAARLAKEFAALPDDEIVAALRSTRSTAHVAAVLSRAAGAFGDAKRTLRQASKIYDNVRGHGPRDSPKAPPGRVTRIRAAKQRRAS